MVTSQRFVSFVIFLAGEVLIKRLSKVWAKCWLFVGALDAQKFARETQGC